MSEPVATFSMAQLKDALENIGLSSDPRDKTVSPVELWAALHEAGAEPGERKAGVTRWHCYTLAYESIYSADVDAAGPNEAAVMAAEQTGKDGTWTVVDGSAVQVQLTEKHTYEVTGFAPDVRTGPPRTVPSVQELMDPLIKGMNTSGLGAPIKDGPPMDQLMVAYAEAGDSSAPLLLGGDVVSRSDWLDSLEVWANPTPLLVGKGGPGGDPTIPVCPVCGSYGGGGHGGGCPNSGKPLLDWVKLAS
jgi:hypothetical protein